MWQARYIYRVIMSRIKDMEMRMRAFDAFVGKEKRQELGPVVAKPCFMLPHHK